MFNYASLLEKRHAETIISTAEPHAFLFSGNKNFALPGWSLLFRFQNKGRNLFLFYFFRVKSHESAFKIYTEK